MFCFSRLIAAAALVAVALPATQASAQDASLTVFAAASMKNALDDTDVAFTKATGVKVVASYAASSALVKQIEQGAPADVFISADLKSMDYAADHKLIKPDTRVNLLGNVLVLIAAKNSNLDKIDLGKGFDIAKLVGDGRIAVANVKAVPAGLYAKAALESLGAWAAAEPKLAMAEDVRSALASSGRHGADHESGSHALSELFALVLSQGHLRALRLQLSDQADIIEGNVRYDSFCAKAQG